MSEQKKFYLTTPIYYVNARPHIGHAYTTIVGDVLARRHRLLGDDTFFLTGTDEHGQKIERSAAAAGIAPQQFADEVSAAFQTLWKRMGITNDDYIRTTSAKHQQGAQKLFADLYKRGFIYLSTYTGQYSIGEEMFVDGPPGTIGPDGKPTETVTEENFFFKLSEFQRPLIDLIESGELKIENEARRNEVLSFLRGNVHAAAQSNLASIQADDERDSLLAQDVVPPLGELIANEGQEPFPLAGTPTQALSYSDAGIPYVEGALKDLSVSRSSFTWGIPVPDAIAQDAGATQKHVIYVWLDALANYMTAVGYGSDAPEDKARFEKYWPADLHLVGKEIIRFHCVYWPAFLMAAKLPLPKAITAHGWLLFDNSKMSKSKGNIVRTETILDAFGTLCPPSFTGLEKTSAGLESGFAEPEDGSSGLEEGFSPPSTPPEKGALAPGFSAPTKVERDLFGSDVLRYFLLREIPFGQDGSFSFDALITRYNADLANGYGNLVSRTLALIGQNFNGIIPSEDLIGQEPASDWSEGNMAVGKAVNAVAGDMNPSFSGVYLPIEESWEELWLNDVLRLISDEITRVDGMLAETKPWKLAKSSDIADSRSLASSLYAAAECIRIITILLHPFIPATTAKVWQQLGLGDIEQAAKNGELKNLAWGGLKPGTKLGPLGPIFPRADKSLTETMIHMEETKLGTQNSELETESTNPAAAPRAIALDGPNGVLPVAGSAAHTTGHDGTPSHTEAQASGIFAGTPNDGPADSSPQITIDDFAKVELRVAQILVAERIPKADKLLRLEVDLGYEKRQILSGIAEFYAPEDLIGRKIVVITNLAPRKMRGLESHGMLLAASDGENGKPILATMSEDIALGSRLK